MGKCRRACTDSRSHNCGSLAQLRLTIRSTTVGMCCRRDLQFSHRPDGRLTFCSLFAGRWCLCPGWHSFNRQLPSVFQPSYQRARSSSKVPIAPMGDSHFARILQGGGVYVLSGTVAISSCTISGNTAQAVRVPMFKRSHSPDGKMADVLASTLARTTAADAPVIYRMYVP
jgi:hypothetical protein